MRWLRDVSPADWIGERLHPWFQDTGSIIPEGFDAYARVFHPVHGEERWSDVAARNGRIVHAEMQLHMISRRAGAAPPRGYQPGDGFDTRLGAAERRALGEVLARFTTSTDRCWSCTWEGYGGFDDQGVGERVRHPGREYVLALGPLADVVEEGANIWWPDDRAWVVVSEIDFAWTYVGGTDGAIGQVLANSALEALPARLSDKPFYDGDLLNADLSQ